MSGVGPPDERLRSGCDLRGSAGDFLGSCGERGCMACCEAWCGDLLETAGEEGCVDRGGEVVGVLEEDELEDGPTN